MIHKLDNIPINTTLESALKKLSIEEPEDAELISGLFQTAKEIARPKVLYREAFVEGIDGPRVRVGNVEFQSAVLAMNLKNIHRVFAYVCTCGAEVDDWSHTERDYVVSLWLDMIKEMFLHEAVAYFREHLKNAFQIEKLSAINPGSGNKDNWPISQQKELFSLIGGVKEAIGVTLTESCLMVPVKSTSGLFFPSEKEYVNCSLCNRENCAGRRAEFDPALYEKAFMSGAPDLSVELYQNSREQ